MNNKNNKLSIILLLIYFIIMFALSLGIFNFIKKSYNSVSDSNEVIETQIKELDINEEKDSEEKSSNTLIEIERTSSYKIFVDKETRNMYIKSNSYSDDNFVMMYDGDVPKIYKGIIEGESYEEFQKGRK